jgi:hypothetical protein
MDSQNIKPLAETDTATGLLPTGGLSWIQVLAIVGLIVVAVAYVMDAGRSGAQPMRTAIAEPGTTILPSIR